MNLRFFMYLALGLFSVILTGNTNNNPTVFMERIFIPIRIGSATFHYAGIITLVLLWISVSRAIRAFNKTDRKSLKKITFLVILVTIFTGPGLVESGVRLNKSYAGGLTPLYTQRESNELVFATVEGSIIELTGTFYLENLSKEDKEFFIKLEIPHFIRHMVAVDEVIAVDLDNEEFQFKMEGREKRSIKASFLLELSEDFRKQGGSMGGGSVSGRVFTFYLFNENHEVVFLKEYQ